MRESYSFDFYFEGTEDQVEGLKAYMRVLRDQFEGRAEMSEIAESIDANACFDPDTWANLRRADGTPATVWDQFTMHLSCVHAYLEDGNEDQYCELMTLVEGIVEGYPDIWVTGIVYRGFDDCVRHLSRFGCGFLEVVPASDPDDSAAKEETLELRLARLAVGSPLIAAIEGTGYLGRAARVEGMRPGDELVLASDWQNKWFDPCAIEVFDGRGKTLGNLSLWMSECEFGPNKFEELALLLPHATVTVQSVTPVSQQGRGAKYPLMDVRIELDAAAAVAPCVHAFADGSIAQTAEAQLRLPAARRTTMSRTDLALSDLKGNINTEGCEPNE